MPGVKGVLKKGFSVLEVLILIMITAFAIAIVGASLLKPKQVISEAKPAIIIYSANVVGNISDTTSAPVGFCDEAALELYKEGILASDKPVTFGNATGSKYAYVLIIYVANNGVIDGVKLSSPEGGMLYKVIEQRKALNVGKYLVCIYTDKLVENTKITFLGAINTCINCVAS